MKVYQSITIWAIIVSLLLNCFVPIDLVQADEKGKNDGELSEGDEVGDSFEEVEDGEIEGKDNQKGEVNQKQGNVGKDQKGGGQLKRDDRDRKRIDINDGKNNNNNKGPRLGVGDLLPKIPGITSDKKNGGAITDTLTGTLGAPLSLANLGKDHNKILGPPPSVVAKEVLSSRGPFDDITDLTKLLNPFEFVKKVSEVFTIPLGKLIDTVGRGLVFGLEVFLQPPLITLKLIEKIFQPDCGVLRLCCNMGKGLGFLRSTVTRFSHGFLDGSQYIKAFTNGIIGHDCESSFPGKCEPKLRKPFENLRIPGLKF